MAIIQLRRFSWGYMEGFRAICSRRCAVGGVRNLIGRRTESDWTADANGEKSREITTNRDCKYETFLITLQTKTLEHLLRGECVKTHE